MTDVTIILFLCNWNPYAAFQALQEPGPDLLPSAIKVIRIPCTGRITLALLFKAFEMGADGVALAGCAPGTCRHGSGTEHGLKTARTLSEILELTGLGRERMRLATFLPGETGKLDRFLRTFASDLALMDKSPIKGFSPDQHRPAGKNESFESSLADIIAAYDAYTCQDCGKCTSSCTLALAGKDFSPRALVTALIHGDITSDSVQENIWSCLTCGVCSNRCPSGVNFPELIQKVRALAEKDITGQPCLAHGGFFQSLMRAMSHPGIQQKRWKTLPADIKTDPDAKVLFHGGCAPYFDLFFIGHLPVDTSDILENALKLLNFFDLNPVVLENERCCGHDLLWSGDRDGFLKLASLNQDVLNGSGITEMITACPECYRTFAHDYPANGMDLNFKVTHLYEFLEQEIEKTEVSFKGLDRPFTFQDSCRLNSLDTIKHLPRKLISRLTRDHFKEMPDIRDSLICCGNNAWTGCDAFSKAIQVKRIKQAKQTGSDLMVTACPKCRIHLECAMKDPFAGSELKIKLMDLTQMIATHICREQGKTK